MKTIIPTSPTPPRAKLENPFVVIAVAKLRIVVPPIIAAIIPKTIYKIKAVIFLNGYAIASLIISPIFI